VYSVSAVLFNSHAFIFIFLPLALLGFFVLARRGPTLASWWLIAASLFFYAWWNPAEGRESWSPKYLALIVASIVCNYWTGVWINRARDTGDVTRARRILRVGVAINLAALAWFKYAAFFTHELNALLGTNWDPGRIALPLAISFFTFTQIAYLVDAWHGVTREYHFRWYALFVSFFPHLIAGPIVHYRRLMPQFARTETWRFNPGNFARGLTLFIFGLTKKVVIADTIAPVANLVFGAAAGGGAGGGTSTAWIGAIAYTLQLYFDFSGYSDMAIGIGRMFNIAFPQNFASPYQAGDLIEFWRRWHITLSQFLRDHLYIPLGGNRHGVLRRYANLLGTMLLGGLWHGAGWTFVIWGGLHGVGLIVNHFWLNAIRERAWARGTVPRLCGRAITLLVIVVGWVFFRAESLDHAVAMLRSMAGLQTGTPLPLQTQRLAMMVFAAVLALFGPNTETIFRLAQPADGNAAAAPRWRLTALSACATALLFVVVTLHLSRFSEFLYFQF